MPQKTLLRLPALGATACIGLLLLPGAGLAASDRPAVVQVLPIQAPPPPQQNTPQVQVSPDDQSPLTPAIRPHGRDGAPDLKPEPPDRKAEPKSAPNGKKEAQPAPPPEPKTLEPRPGQKPDSKPSLRADPKVPGIKSGAKAADKPGLAVAQPRTAAEREKALSDLYAYLATAEDAKQAQTISGSIERLWVTSGSDTVGLLMQRAMGAINGKNPELALKLLDAVVALAPDYAEGWNRRAYVHYTQNEVDLALGDLRRTLALDPNHFKALDGLVHILKDIGRKKEALQAARRLLDVNPYHEAAKQVVDELAREIEGRGI